MHNDLVQWVEILFEGTFYPMHPLCFEAVILRKHKNLKKFVFKRMGTSSIKKTASAMISNYYYGVSFR